MAIFMDRPYLNSIAPLVKEKFAWDAFVAILEYEKSKLVNKLKGKQEIDELMLINAQFMLLERLKKTQENALLAEKEYAINKR